MSVTKVRKVPHPPHMACTFSPPHPTLIYLTFSPPPVSPSLSQTIHSFTLLSIPLSIINSFIHPSIPSSFPSFIPQSLHPFISPSIHLSIHPLIHLIIHPSLPLLSLHPSQRWRTNKSPTGDCRHHCGCREEGDITWRKKSGSPLRENDIWFRL